MPNRKDSDEWSADSNGCAITGSIPEPIRATVGLRICGDALDPVKITRLLGIDPTGYARKGDIHRTASGRDAVALSGSWRLNAGVPGNLDTQIGALLTKLQAARPSGAN